jgi:PelA/Pel-15E family pectate lyase
MQTRPALLLLLASTLYPQSPAAIEAAMKKAATYFSQEVATNGGYHYTYADDLSYGRSEHGEGPTQIELQRAATPAAGLAFLEAWWATGDRFYLDAAAAAARSAVSGQLCSGGWDYLVEFDPAKRARYPYRKDNNCPVKSDLPTTLDDNVTQGVLRLLMRVDRERNFQNAEIHESALFALDKLLAAQYANGAWPQRFTGPAPAAGHQPKKASYPAEWSRQWPGEIYKLHYTLNDNTLADMIDMMLEAGRIYNNNAYTAAARRAGDFLLLAQMPDPQPAWAQQYDENMHPAWARVFEPPSISGGESQGICRILLVLYRETGEKKYIDAVGPALKWLEASVLPGTTRLARFNELKTNRPLYITKGTQIQARGLGSKRIDGYELSYSPEKGITHYALQVSAAELPNIRRDYDAALSKRTPRPDRLHNLSPWSDEHPESPGDTAKIIATLNEQGAWTQQGTIGKAEKIVSVFAPRPMVLTINGRPTPIAENDRIELFDGSIPPRQTVVSTATFARNLERLAASLLNAKRTQGRAPNP